MSKSSPTSILSISVLWKMLWVFHTLLVPIDIIPLRSPCVHLRPRPSLQTWSRDTWRRIREVSMLNQGKVYCATEMLKEQPRVANPILITCTHHVDNSYVQNAEGPNPVQRYEFYNVPMGNLLNCAKSLLWSRRYFFVHPSLRDYCENPCLSNLQANVPSVFFIHVLGRRRF